MCARHGVDILGFVVDYPHPVPWNIDAALAGDLLPLARPRQTCIVVGGPREQTYDLALRLTPDYVQLHDRESLEDTAWLVDRLGRHGIKVIKTLFPGPDLVREGQEFCATGVHALLLDPRSPENARHGAPADLELFQALQQAVPCPVMLAGGIRAENVADLIRRTHPGMIDLMTGVEVKPGEKDEAKVVALLEGVRSASQ